MLKLSGKEAGANGAVLGNIMSLLIFNKLEKKAKQVKKLLRILLSMWQSLITVADIKSSLKGKDKVCTVFTKAILEVQYIDFILYSLQIFFCLFYDILFLNLMAIHI